MGKGKPSHRVRVSEGPSCACRFPRPVHSVAGASEIVLQWSSSLLWPENSAGRNDSTSGRLVSKTLQRSEAINRNVIEAMARLSLRTLGLAFRCRAGTLDVLLGRDPCIPFSRCFPFSHRVPV